MKKDDKKKKTTRAAQSKSGKPSKQPKPAAKPSDKTTGEKRTPAIKPSAPKKTPVAPKKPAAVQKPAKPAAPKKPAAAKAPKLKPIKHSDAEENKIGTISPVHIIKRDIKPQAPRHRVLKRVAKSGGYTAFDGARAGKTFATPSEAANYAAYVFACTGKVIEVAPTSRQVTHTFEPEEQKKKK